MTVTKMQRVYWFHLQILFFLCLNMMFYAAHASSKVNQDKFYKSVIKQYGESAGIKVTNWLLMLNQVEDTQAEMQKVRQINQYFDRTLRYDEDPNIFAKKDHWAPISETLARGIGDCEDHAIAKYYSLRMTGVAEDKLRLLYVKARVGGPNSKRYQAHIVLGYFPAPGEEPFILDSLTSAIQPLSARRDLLTKYSFNSQFLWVARKQFNLSSSSKIKLSKWQRVLELTEQSGIVLG